MAKSKRPAPRRRGRYPARPKRYSRALIPLATKALDTVKLDAVNNDPHDETDPSSGDARDYFLVRDDSAPVPEPAPAPPASSTSSSPPPTGAPPEDATGLGAAWPPHQDWPAQVHVQKANLRLALEREREGAALELTRRYRRVSDALLLSHGHNVYMPKPLRATPQPATFKAGKVNPLAGLQPGSYTISGHPRGTTPGRPKTGSSKRTDAERAARLKRERYFKTLPWPADFDPIDQGLLIAHYRDRVKANELAQRFGTKLKVMQKRLERARKAALAGGVKVKP